MDIDRQKVAADRILELAIASTEVVRLLRTKIPETQAYALAYVLRRELGYVVRNMGKTGNPTVQAQMWAEEQINEAILRSQVKRD